jgi:two-component system, NtrC family, nitrogen regulation sensor histidine kinase NtrY
MKKFRIQSLLRILLIVATIALTCLSFNNAYYFPAIVLIVLCAIQVILLFRLIDSSNKELKKFLEGISFSDFTQNINLSVLGGSYKELADEMVRILENIRQARIEKEESLRYLQTVVEHIGIGLICFNARGEVELINKSAKRILKISHLKNLDALDKKFDQFGEYLINFPSNKRQTYRLNSDGEILQLYIAATEFRMKSQEMKLVSFSNIQRELEEKEIEAWQKLIRVLTHEIMNSITPISSLASTVNVMLKDSAETNSIQEETVSDVRQAVNTIQKRSEGLISFVDKFRDISKIPKPNFQTVKVSELFYRIRLLSEPILSQKKINFSVEINPEHLEIIVDPELIEQVIINLVNNSVQAIDSKENSRILLKAEIDDRGRAVLKVIDNGSGIPEDLQDKIFIPFFSTKKEGSGIGLSISQRIIRAHGGSIWVYSKPNEETVFTIRL